MFNGLFQTVQNRLASLGSPLHRGVLALLFSSLPWAVQAQSQVAGDFHLQLYQGGTGEITDLELFTKQPKAEVFFGVTCSVMSPFPLVQVLLFNEAVISETPRFLSVSYSIDGQTPNSAVALQGILKPVDTFDERSNKIRLELEPAALGSMQAMQSGYQAWLKQLKQGKTLAVKMQSRSLGEYEYAFSLEGLQELLEPNEAICR